MSDTVQVEMTKEQVARLWAAQRGFCLIDWEVLNELLDLYRESGAKTIVYHPQENTYLLREKDDRPTI
jgi:hypothetical protein